MNSSGFFICKKSRCGAAFAFFFSSRMNISFSFPRARYVHLSPHPHSSGSRSRGPREKVFHIHTTTYDLLVVGAEYYPNSRSSPITTPFVLSSDCSLSLSKVFGSPHRDLSTKSKALLWPVEWPMGYVLYKRLG